MSRAALANGRYPLANQLVVDPHDASHLVVRATFGILESHDAGASWTWICEDALGVVGSAEDPVIAVTADGSTLVASSQGLSITHEGCAWSAAAGLPAGRFAVDVTVNPVRPHEALAIESVHVVGPYRLYLVKTTDDGATWSDVGEPLLDVLASTVEMAPSNPDRIYVTGKVIATLANALWRSDDGGRTFTELPIDGVAASSFTYVGAVDPQNPDVVFLRVPPSGDTGGRVLVSRDAGASFAPLWSGPGDVAGFALSPDGTMLAVGGAESGLHVGSTRDGIFEVEGTIRPSCLTWAGTELFVCAKEATDLFSVGVSRDGGARFVPLLHFSQIAPRDCADAGTAGVCSAKWPPIAATIGADAGLGARDSGGVPEAAKDAGQSAGCGCGLSGGIADARASLLVLAGAFLAHRFRFGRHARQILAIGTPKKSYRFRVPSSVAPLEGPRTRQNERKQTQTASHIQPT
jgi:hypothetical protein